MFKCQPALQEELVKNGGTVELAWTILGINRASGVLKPQGKICKHHRFTVIGLQKHHSWRWKLPFCKSPWAKWDQMDPRQTAWKHFLSIIYCSNSSINFRLQDSELQALWGTRSRLKSQDLLCATGIIVIILHIIRQSNSNTVGPSLRLNGLAQASHLIIPLPFL